MPGETKRGEKAVLPVGAFDCPDATTGGLVGERR
jgi:hypothetical protein